MRLLRFVLKKIFFKEKKLPLHCAYFLGKEDNIASLREIIVPINTFSQHYPQQLFTVFMEDKFPIYFNKLKSCTII